MGRMSAMIVGLVMLVGTTGVTTNEAEGRRRHVSNRTLDKKLDRVLDKQTEILEQLAGPQECPSNFAPVAQTGQKDCWDTLGNIVSCPGTGQDGDLRAGVPWPNPRFTKNGDGTVTDNLTGLIWLGDWDCLGKTTWVAALTAANTLSHANPQGCVLTDGSVAGDWRLPNRKELLSLVSDFYEPAVSDTAGTGQWTAGDPFTNVQNVFYWSSSSHINRNAAWVVTFATGKVDSDGKEKDQRVLAVSGGGL